MWALFPLWTALSRWLSTTPEVMQASAHPSRSVPGCAAACRTVRGLCGWGLSRSAAVQPGLEVHIALQRVIGSMCGLSGAPLAGEFECVVAQTHQAFSHARRLLTLGPPAAADFLMDGFGMSEDVALATMSLGVDFGATQVVRLAQPSPAGPRLTVVGGSVRLVERSSNWKGKSSLSYFMTAYSSSESVRLVERNTNWKGKCSFGSFMKLQATRLSSEGLQTSSLPYSIPAAAVPCERLAPCLAQVDGNLGIHTIVPKFILDPTMPAVSSPVQVMERPLPIMAALATLHGPQVCTQGCCARCASQSTLVMSGVRHEATVWKTSMGMSQQKSMSLLTVLQSVSALLVQPYTPQVWPGTSVPMEDPAYIAY